MHMILRLVVKAQSVDEATKRAIDYFNKKLHYEEGGPFDYYKLMVNDTDVSGSGRWRLYRDEPLAFKAESLTGFREIQSAWDATVGEAERAIEKMSEAFEEAESAEEVMDDWTISAYSRTFGYGPNASRYLYWVDRYEDWSGAAVGESKVYNELTDAVWDGDYYVVPMDVHY